MDLISEEICQGDLLVADSILRTLLNAGIKRIETIKPINPSKKTVSGAEVTWANQPVSKMPIGCIPWNAIA